jgi:hypothetical protein
MGLIAGWAITVPMYFVARDLFLSFSNNKKVIGVIQGQ